MHFSLIPKDGSETSRISVSPDVSGRIVLKPEEVSGEVEAIEFHDEFFTAQAGEDGFLLAPSYFSSGDSVYADFIPREDCEKVFDEIAMPLYASGKPGHVIMVIVEGMEYEFDLVCGVKDGRYYMYPRFKLECGFYEPIILHCHHFTGENADIAALARFYRDEVLLKQERPLRERVKDQPVLKQALLGPKVRIRMGWKAMPPVVIEQDPRMPQPVHCALTFDRMRDIIDAFKKAGIDNAEFCLVGWNVGGHDGQYPDLLPVEPSCGGEEALKRLNEYARSQGYLIGAHTNNHDSYSGAETFAMRDMQRGKDGNVLMGGKWCGGQSRFICPKVTNDKYLERDMNTVKDLGFAGTHYFDVTALVCQSPCFHPDHPLNRKQASECRRESFAVARQTFGASSSEGCLPYAIGTLDYGLYMLWTAKKSGEDIGIFNHSFPFRFIAEHGLVHYNCYSNTVNAPLKDDPSAALLNLALGGQPCFYYYSKFRKDSPWGQVDLTADGPEDLAAGVELIRKDYECYKKFRDLQLLFIQDIRSPGENVIETCYEDGTRTLFNGTSAEYRWNGGFNSPPLSLARISADGNLVTLCKANLEV